MPAGSAEDAKLEGNMAAAPAYAVPFPAPANQPPADLAAATSTYSAPAIPANAAPNAADLIHAVRETRSKKRARDEGKLITDHEYGSALVRQHAIASEHARFVYGGVAGVPQWGATLQQTLDDHIATMNTRLIQPSFISNSQNIA
jgi:hypothetical protein